MGQAAGRGADIVLVTSDNPRREDPQIIVDAIVPGITELGVEKLADLASLGQHTRGYVVEVDRRAAIGLALSAARRGDVVLVAGKGHEDYQIVGTEKRPFDDRIVVAEAIKKLLNGGSPPA